MLVVGLMGSNWGKGVVVRWWELRIRGIVGV